MKRSLIRYLGFSFILFFGSFLHAQETTFPLSDGFKTQKTLILDLTGKGTFTKVQASSDGKHFLVIYTKDNKSTLWVDGKILATANNGNLYAYFKKESDLYYWVKREGSDYLFEYFKNGKSLGIYGSLSVHISPDQSLEIYEVSLPKEKFVTKHFLIINGKKQEEFDEMKAFRFTDEGHDFTYIGSNRKKGREHLVSTNESYLLGNHSKLGPYDRIEDLSWTSAIGSKDLFIGTKNKMDYLISKGKIIDQAEQINQAKPIQGKLFYTTCEDKNCFNPSQETPDDLFGICEAREIYPAAKLVQEAHTKLWVHWGNEKLGPYEYVDHVGPNDTEHGFDKSFGSYEGYPAHAQEKIFGFLAKKNNQYFAVINFQEIPLPLNSDEAPLHLILSEDPKNFAVLLGKDKKQLIWHNNERSEAFDVICNPRLTPDGKQLAFVGSNYVTDTEKKPVNFLGAKVQPNKILQSTVINGKKTSYPEGCLNGPIVTKNPPGFAYTFNPILKKRDSKSERGMNNCNLSKGKLVKNKSQKTFLKKPYYKTKISDFKAIAPFETKFNYPKGNLQVLSKNFDYDKENSAAYHGPFKIYYDQNYLGLVDYIFDAKLSSDEKNLGVLILQGNQIRWVVNAVRPFHLDYPL